jgi:hypothetical protein
MYRWGMRLVMLPFYPISRSCGLSAVGTQQAAEAIEAMNGSVARSWFDRLPAMTTLSSCHGWSSLELAAAYRS